MKIILIFLFGISVFAQEREGLLNKLLAPGPLSKVHSNIEGSCLKCHDAGQGIPDSKCLDCHKDIQKFTSQKIGFHGLTNTSCIKCHAEHKGRDSDTTVLDSSKFSHELTGFKLDGKHSVIKCSECHFAKRTGKTFRPNELRYLGKTNSCKDCHKKEDIHQFTGQYSKQDCNSCHATQNWKQNIKFSHNETRFKLEAKHAELKCNDCHKKGKYIWSNLEKDKCLSCHQNVHKNNLSARFSSGECTTCHSQTSWKLPKFDHSITKFALRGKHQDLKCTDCHKQTVKDNPSKSKWIGLSKNCISCHKDYHQFSNFKSNKNKNLSNCASCHTENNWHETSAFNHNKNTGFAITGKHLELKCNECHVPKGIAKYHWAELKNKDCETCHKNPHIGQFTKKTLEKKCSECHITEGWKLQPRNFKDTFDHSKTRFSLTGAHTTIACANCHVVKDQQVFKFASFDQKFCVDCHQNQHKGQFSDKLSQQSCAVCHSTNSFSKLLAFDHSKTNFNLSGAHTSVDCTKCHTSTKEKFVGKTETFKHKFLFPELNSKSCTSCHKDPHVGQLSQNCTQCHNDKNWKDLKFNHNLDSDFKLRWKHENLKCSECHKPKNGVVQYKPLSKKCVDCHRDPHKGQFGQNCNGCHAEKGWNYTRDFHRNFGLQGVHYTIACNECHRDNRKLTGLSDQCVFCHQKDDIHNGALPKCGECHKQQFWENAEFKHSMTSFPLRGVHRTLDCFQCHSRGIYTGLPASCIDCHLRDAQAVTSPPHTFPAYNNCSQCHNQFGFN